MTTKKPTFLNRVYAIFGTKTKKHTRRTGKKHKKVAKKTTKPNICKTTKKHITKQTKGKKITKTRKTKKTTMKGGMVRAGSRPDTWPVKS